MEFRIKCPANAIDVENLIRTQCQHFGYPEAKLEIDHGTSELVLKLHDPSPLNNTIRPTPIRPGVAVESTGIPRLKC
jgi:hypothetical protein